MSAHPKRNKSFENMQNYTPEIDFVVPMVFADDPQWQRALREYGDGDNAVRWRSWGTEELMLRRVRKHLPWLRTIHILLASESQVCPWMLRLADTPGPALHFVFHPDFIEPPFYPCFVSRTIEMFLHRIPGLAEQFIYANDDMFPLSDLKPEQFFRNGKPCQFVREKPFPKNPNLFELACQHGLNMVAGVFGRHYTNTWLRNGHTFQPILLTTCRAVWASCGKEIRATIAPKRDDKAPNQYIYFYYQHLSGHYVADAPRRKFVSIRKVTTEQLRNILTAPDAGIVCVNDHEDVTNWEAYAEVTRQCLARGLFID